VSSMCGETGSGLLRNRARADPDRFELDRLSRVGGFGTSGREGKAMRSIAAVSLGLILAAATLGPAQAKGCLKGAAVGGVAGHVVGHHGLLGAAAGCAVGHHEASRDERAARAQQADRNNNGDPSGRDAH
jgi:hypothetical protein